MQLSDRVDYVKRILRVAPTRREIAVLAAALDMPDPDRLPEAPWFAAMHLVLKAEEFRGTLTVVTLRYVLECAERSSGAAPAGGDGAGAA